MCFGLTGNGIMKIQKIDQGVLVTLWSREDRSNEWLYGHVPPSVIHISINKVPRAGWYVVIAQEGELEEDRHLYESAYAWAEDVEPLLKALVEPGHYIGYRSRSMGDNVEDEVYLAFVENGEMRYYTYIDRRERDIVLRKSEGDEPVPLGRDLLWFGVGQWEEKRKKSRDKIWDTLGISTEENKFIDKFFNK